MKNIIRNTAVLALVSVAALAVETRTWQHANAEDFSKGSFHDLSLRTDGRLSLAPASRELLDPSTSALWAVAEDSRGNIYTGGGGPGSQAKLFRIDPSGESTVLAELEGLEIQAIAVNKQDEVFVATTPDGAIYKIGQDTEVETVFQPDAKYIWAMAIDSNGDLYIGTGDLGRIYKVSPGGQGAVFFETEETHVRSLAVDANDNVIAGTEPGGLILRISSGAEAFVLHQSEKREITAVAVDSKGTVYAAGVGDKKAAPAVPASPAIRPVSPVKPATTGAAPTPQPQPQPSVTTRRPVRVIQTQVTGGSEIIRIDPDGYPRVVWSDDEQIVYSLAFDPQGRPVFGTGNEGRIYRIDTEQLTTRLLNLPPAQITALHVTRGGRLYAATSNIGKLYAIGPELEQEGWFESAVLDSESFSYWGRIRFRGDVAAEAIRLQTRSGNLDRPQQNWSEWEPVELNSSDGRVQSPAARFLQYKLTLRAPGGEPPTVSEINVAYLHKNVAPRITTVVATPPNYRFPPKSLTLTKNRNITLPPLTETKRPAPKTITTITRQSMQYEKGFVGARWLVEDNNGDELRYQVEIRGAAETEWKLLAEDLQDPHVSWDSTAFSDGEYQVRVTASDAPSTPPQQALEAALVSEPFLIDNTPPSIEGLAAEQDDGSITVSWRAVDSRTVIRKAEYSLDGGEWMVVQPTTRLSDSRSLDYELTLPEAGPGEHTVAVRVTDEFDNQAVAKVVVR